MKCLKKRLTLPKFFLMGIKSVAFFLPCTQRRTRSRWNHTASWAAARRSFCPSWAKRDVWDVFMSTQNKGGEKGGGEVLLLQLAAGPKHFFLSRPVPRIQLRPSERPGKKNMHGWGWQKGMVAHVVKRNESNQPGLPSILVKPHLPS